MLAANEKDFHWGNLHAPTPGMMGGGKAKNG
jgi:hypothetical protein